ncbi:MAG: YeiH family protein [Clostridiaceae bacterium]
MKKIQSILPGFILALTIAFVARFLESLLPVKLVGASVLALFIGIIIRQVISPSPAIQAGIKFTSKRVLKFSIILLGASLNVATILKVGQLSLIVMLFTLITCFGGGYLVGKWLNLNWKLSNMISAGTGICGGSAIAALAPVIEADDNDIAYAIAATFLFDIAMIVLFPIMGKMMNLSDMAYGLWAGTAVNDTSSVVAAGYAFSEAAGDFATMVKLTRTLSIIPVVLIFSIYQARQKSKVSGYTKPSFSNVSSIIPWFILGFLAMAMVNSIGLIPVAISTTMRVSSKFLMVAALAAIGLNTNVSEMRKSGINPMIHGFIISALVIIVALAVEIGMGLV